MTVPTHAPVSEHDWDCRDRHLSGMGQIFSAMNKLSYYRCKRCGAEFVHFYDQQELDAAIHSQVPKECTA